MEKTLISGGSKKRTLTSNRDGLEKKALILVGKGVCCAIFSSQICFITAY